MASSKEHVDHIIEQLNIATGGNVSSRAMMGEYVVYYRDKVIGGIYNDRLLVKVTKSSQELLADAPLEIPYQGAKEMLKIEESEDHAFNARLFEAMYPELPARKPRKKKA